MFNRALKLMTLGGFDIKVDPSWLIIAILVTWSLSAQYFPSAFPGQTPFSYLAMAVAGMLGFFGSLLLHEMAHAVVARRFGVGIKSITLFLFGGVAEMQSEPREPGAEIRIALAGPAASLALAIAFRATASIAAVLDAASSVTQVLAYLGTINLILGLFNLLPAFPLDGGRVLRAILWIRSGDMLKATETAANSGTILAYMLMGLGLMAILNGFLIAGFWQILLGSFLLVAARSGYQQQLQKAVLADRTVADVMTRAPITVTPDMTLSDVIDGVVLRHRVSFLPVLEDGALLGHIDTDVLSKIDRDNWNSTTVDDIFVALSDSSVQSPSASLPELMEDIQHTGQRKFLVAEGHRLVGVITLADLTRFIGLAHMLGPRHVPS